MNDLFEKEKAYLQKFVIYFQNSIHFYHTIVASQITFKHHIYRKKFVTIWPVTREGGEVTKFGDKW